MTPKMSVKIVTDSEIIIIDNEEYNLLCEPLASYLEEKNLKFDSYHTTCRRGYAGTWELKGKELYLIDFKGKIDGTEVGLKFLFPNANKDETYDFLPLSVKATWFTGRLRIELNDMIEYAYDYFIYSDEIVMDMEQGNMVKTSFWHHEYDDNDKPF